MEFHICSKKVLGCGYYGEVHLGFVDSTPVAAKKVLCGPSLHEEARFLQLCNHENVIRSIGGVLEYKGVPYLVMELAEKGTLGEKLGLNLFSAKAKRLLVQQLCLGLDHLQSKQIVHRDINPKNLLLKKISPPHLVISDFGNAQMYVEGSYKPSQHEIVKDAVYTFKSDVYLASLVAYEIFEDARPSLREMLTGRILAQGFNARIFTERTWQAILGALDRNPEIRPTAIEFHEKFNC